MHQRHSAQLNELAVEQPHRVAVEAGRAIGIGAVVMASAEFLRLNHEAQQLLEIWICPHMGHLLVDSSALSWRLAEVVGIDHRAAD